MAGTVKIRGARVALRLGAIAGALLVAASAAAQTPAVVLAASETAMPSDLQPPSPEAVRLATIIANGYVESAMADMPAQFDDMLNLPMFKSPVFHSAPFNDPALVERYPGWIEASRSAMFAAMADCKPRVEALLARMLAERFSIDELRAGAQFITSPGGQYAARVYAYERPAVDMAQVKSALSSTPHNAAMDEAMVETLDAVNAKAHRPLPPAAEAALAQLKQTAAGRKFVSDAENAGALFKDYLPDYLRIVMGPVFLHLSESLAADQARHDAAAKDAPTPEALALGVSVVHGVDASIDEKTWSALSTFVAAAMNKVPTTGSGLSPEYFQAFSSTMLDTFRYDQPVVEQALGRALARLCTTDDLRALAEFTNGPAPGYFVKVALAKLPGADGQASAPPPMPPEVRAAMNKLAKSGVIQRLGARLEDTAAREDLMRIGIDTSVPIAAQWMHRLGDRFEAMDAAH